MKSLWPEPQDPNPAGALSGYVGAGAPLVAGFELAALVLLIVSPGAAADVPLIGPVMVAMVTSAALLVFSIRYGFWAVSYWTTPAERLMWDPAAVVADLPLQRQRRLLAGRMLEFGKLRRRAEHLFQIGIFVFLIAVALLLVPGRWHASSADWRWAAASVAGLAGLVHLLWSAGNWRHHRNARVYRRLTAKSAGPGDLPGPAGCPGAAPGRPAGAVLGRALAARPRCRDTRSGRAGRRQPGRLALAGPRDGGSGVGTCRDGSGVRARPGAGQDGGRGSRRRGRAHRCGLGNGRPRPARHGPQALAALTGPAQRADTITTMVLMMGCC